MQLVFLLKSKYYYFFLLNNSSCLASKSEIIHDHHIRKYACTAKNVAGPKKMRLVSLLFYSFAFHAFPAAAAIIWNPFQSSFSLSVCVCVCPAANLHKLNRIFRRMRKEKFKFYWPGLKRTRVRL